MKRARTLTGLFVQLVRMRWSALGDRGKAGVIVGLVLAAAAAFHFGACAFGACSGPCSSAPCEMSSSSPCTRADGSDEPCPYSSRPAPEAAAVADPADTPPCHAR